MLIDTLKEINEGRAESGRGSKAGREKFASKEGTQGRSVKAKKSRVKVYDTIDAALNSGASYGTIFSTKAADRLYVISKPTWGSKSRAGGNTRIAKGFTPGSATPNATWPSIKSHAVRTMIKHGKTKAGRLTKKYGPGRDPDEGKPKKKKLKEANYPKKSKKLAEILPLLTLIKRKLMEEGKIILNPKVQAEVDAAKEEKRDAEAARAEADRKAADQEAGGATPASPATPTPTSPTTPKDETPEKEPLRKTRAAGRFALGATRLGVKGTRLGVEGLKKVKDVLKVPIKQVQSASTWLNPHGPR